MDSGSFKVRSALYLGVCLSVLAVAGHAQMPADGALSPREEEEYGPRGYSAEDLAEALEGLLDESQDNRVSVDKKSLIPRCDVGERCAVKHGPRIGKLCDCLRGAACNTFLLRCY
ncbi:cocaine- and amphetamine-regulated transcript 4 [Lepisosteus oculatus]|uniref:cocaine- and amphetamine-regulated transcript 4 n=1 Tax=Lepisosteus oculatus TaxID=7918 RepID=UPI0037138131